MAADAPSPAVPGSGGLDLGHRFADAGLLREALTHRSVASGASNERLEFLGDRVLGLLIAEWLIERHQDETEGDLGKRLARLVAQPTLVDVAVRIGLADALIVPAAETRAGVRDRPTVVADAVEAVIAALYLDGGLPAARGFVRRHFAEAVGQLDRPPMAAKTRLQEWLQGHGHPLPLYRLAATEGPAHAPRFTVVAEALGEAAEAAAATKRAAEEEAAARLLERLRARA